MIGKSVRKMLRRRFRGFYDPSKVLLYTICSALPSVKLPLSYTVLHLPIWPSGGMRAGRMSVRAVVKRLTWTRSVGLLERNKTEIPC
jgi:hypothetical protein